MKLLHMVVFGILLFQGCEDESFTKTNLKQPYPVNIDFQSGFHNDSVVVLLNGMVTALIDSITSYLGPADSRHYMLAPGLYMLSIVLPKDSLTIDTTFVHFEKELWIGINYTRELQRISIIIQDFPFPYHLM